MNESEIKVLILVSRLKSVKIKDLARSLELSYSRVFQILKKLDNWGLVKLRRGLVEAAPFFADIIMQVDNKYGLIYVLKGSTPIILSKIFEPKTSRQIALEVGLSEKYVRRLLNELTLKGIVIRENNEYCLIDDPLIRVLVLQFSKFIEGIEPEAHVIYRDAYCVIKEVPKGYEARGTKTAFSIYSKYGITIETPRDYYIYPPKDLSDEEVIVHSLTVAKTKYENTLVALLYAKLYYMLDHEKLYIHAKWFNQIDKLSKMDNYLSGTEYPIFLSWEEFRKLAEMYNVDITPFEKRHFREEVFSEIGNALERKLEVYVFGGAVMVLRGYKISTKDVDVALMRKEDMNTLENTLRKLGYELKSSGRFKVYEKGKGSRIDLYLKKIGELELTERMLNRAKKKQYGNLTVNLSNDTDLLLAKLVSGRPRDIEDAKIIIRRGEIDWNAFINELLEQERILSKHFCITAYMALKEIARSEKMHIPYLRKLKTIATSHAVLYAYKELGLRKPRDIAKLLEVSEETIRRILKKQEKRSKQQD